MEVSGRLQVMMKVAAPSEVLVESESCQHLLRHQNPCPSWPCRDCHHLEVLEGYLKEVRTRQCGGMESHWDHSRLQMHRLQNVEVMLEGFAQMALVQHEAHTLAGCEIAPHRVACGLSISVPNSQRRKKKDHTRHTTLGTLLE